MGGKYFLNEYFLNEYFLNEDELIFKRGSICNWDYEIETNFKEKRITAWANSDSACVIHFDERAKNCLELPLLWLEAIEVLDNLMCSYWHDLAYLHYRP